MWKIDKNTKHQNKKIQQIQIVFRSHSELKEGAMNSTLFFIKILENSNPAYFGWHCKSPSGKNVRPLMVYFNKSLYTTWKF